MKIQNYIFLLCILLTNSGFAWTHDISLGYGRSKERNCDYYQQATILDYQVFPFAQIDKTLIFGLGASLVNWHADYKENKSVTNIALSLIFRAYFIPPNQNAKFNPYLTVSYGPAFLFNRKLGERTQGSPFAFQANLGVGTELKVGQKKLDIGLKLLHISNGGIYKPNQGFDVAPVFAIGYLFGK